jgi:hypothetical protein
MRNTSHRSNRPAFTLVELMATCTIGFIVVMTVGTLLYAGQRQWVRAYRDANIGIQMDALKTMIAFGNIGRKSNKNDYVLYEASGGNLVKVTPPSGQPVDLVAGQAIEFRFWDKELSAELMDTKKTATVYALFYLDNKQLKIDRGPYDSITHIGGVDASGRRVTGSDITTTVLAENVTSLIFAHTTKNTDGDGNGCVRMEAVFTDPCDNRSVTIKAATLLRNVWP